MSIETRPRRRVNLSISEEVIAEAKALALNASQAAEAGIARAVKAERERRWNEESADAIRAYNERIAREGVAFPPDWLDD